MGLLFWNILTWLLRAVRCCFSVLWCGLKAVFTSPKKTAVLLVGIGLLLGARCIFPIFTSTPGLLVRLICVDGWMIYPIIYIVFINGGVLHRIKRHFLRKKHRKIFEKIKFISTDNFYPGYVGTTITENMKILTFYSTIPVSVWIKKQGLLESAFNIRFYEIKDRPSNNRLIDIYILTKELQTVIPWSDAYILGIDTLLIGEGYHGRVGMNLEKQPHAFIAGETGSGKSIILQCMIYQALKKHYQVYLIDFKRGVSFSCFSELVNMVVELEQAHKLLSDLIQEVNRRLDLFVAQSVQDIKEYNQKMERTGGKALQRVIVVADELAELVDTGGANKEEKALIQAINRNLRTLARIARAPGVHLLLGIQRPDSSIIDGQIKSNIPFRVCGHYADSPSSIIVLGNNKATALPNIPGRFIADNQEIQAYYFTLKPGQLTDLSSVFTKKNPPEKSETLEMKDLAASETGNLNLDFSEL